jgi:hypothetical protein
MPTLSDILESGKKIGQKLTPNSMYVDKIFNSKDGIFPIINCYRNKNKEELLWS